MGLKTSKQKAAAKAKRRARYGMVKVRVGQKLAWLSRHDKNGWSLGLAVGDLTYWLKNVRLASIAEVKRTLKANTVFVHLKSDKA